jgi:hypothetical protein
MFWRRNLETAARGCPQKVVFWKSSTVRSSTTSIAFGDSRINVVRTQMADENVYPPNDAVDPMSASRPVSLEFPGRIVTDGSTAPKDVLYVTETELQFGLIDPTTKTRVGTFKIDSAGPDSIEDSASGKQLLGYMVTSEPEGGLRRRRSYTKKPERAHPKEKQTRKGRVRSKRNRHREQKRVG